MKLAGLLLIACIGTASAQGYNGPPGAMPMPMPPPGAMPMPPPGAVVGVGVQAVPPGVAFRQMILERFDRNHDGRLGPRERRQAARALRRMAKKLARADRRDGRQPRW
jgi:hypothetical protein